MTTPLRSDRTPCLLFPELLMEGGGLMKAVQERASLFARHYERVLILTTSNTPTSPEVLPVLRERGSLDPRVEVRNFFDRSRWMDSVGEPPPGSWGSRDGVRSKRQARADGRLIRVADKRTGARVGHGYRYYDHDGRLLATTTNSPGFKHELSATGPDGEPLDWSGILAAWVDDELADLPDPVLFSLQRGLNDPVLLATRRPVRKVASLHNCHYVDPEDPASGIRRNFRPLLWQPRAVDEIVCLTEQQRVELRRDVPGAVVRAIRYPGRPPTGPAPEKDPMLVVLVTRLMDRKRVDHAVRAFVDVTRAVPGARLEIYGSGPDQAATQALVDELGLNGSVTLMGYSQTVGQAQARALCALMVSEFEGYARVIGEAMVRGTPVVAYDVRYGPHDLIRHEVDGLLVDVHTPEALAAAIVRLLNDPARAVAMGSRAREIADRLPVEDFERAWLDVVASTRRPPRFTLDALRGARRSRRRRRAEAERNARNGRQVTVARQGPSQRGRRRGEQLTSTS